MKENIFEVLMYLFENYLEEVDDALTCDPLLNSMLFLLSTAKSEIEHFEQILDNALEPAHGPALTVKINLRLAIPKMRPAAAAKSCSRAPAGARSCRRCCSRRRRCGAS